MKKQKEGDNEQRRARAKQARDEGRAASEDGVTTGASNQRRTLGNRADHPERLTARGWGKQQPERAASRPRPGSAPQPDRMASQPDTFPPRGDNSDVRPGELTDEDEQVIEALARLETDGGAPSTSDIAHAADLSHDETVPALQRLVTRHDVVQELPAEPDVGHRYRVKAR